MKQLIYILGLLVMVGTMSSCQNGSDSNQTNLSCPAGTTFYNNACYTGAGGYVQPASYNYQNGFYADTYSGTSSLRVVNGAKMTEFFKFGMGVCDRAGGYNGGLASCQAYVGGSMDMIIQFPPNGGNSLLATFVAQPRYNPSFNYSAQLPSGYGALGIALGYVTGVFLPDPKQYNGIYRNPLQLELAVSAINNSAGFSANGYGDYWSGLNRTKITIEVPQGKIQDNQMSFIFKIGDVPAAQGSFTRCQRLNCGL